MPRHARLFGWLLAGASALAAAADPPRYSLEYEATFVPRAARADVQIRTEPGTGRLIELDLAMPARTYTRIAGDGLIQRHGERVRWQPPRAGGQLSYRVSIDRRREGGGYDSRITPEWAITRGDLLFPPAKVRATKGSGSAARLRLILPPGWDNAETPYSRVGPNEFAVTNPARRFDRPVGWIGAGRLHASRETIAGTRVVLASPDAERREHAPVLAILQLALPQMRDAFGELPEKVLILRSGDPMWRGGLSGPDSLWLHAERPTISANGTSPLLHELTHVFTGIRGAAQDDWIAEGLSEYYSLEFGRRAGLISKKRYERALQAAAEAGDDVASLRGGDSRRERTRAAVAMFAALDVELRGQGVQDGLDALVQALMRRERVDLAELRRDAERVAGEPSKVLAAVD